MSPGTPSIIPRDKSKTSLASQETGTDTEVKSHDAVDVVRDLDKKGPDGSPQTAKQQSNICLYHGLIWRRAKNRRFL